MTMKSPTDGAEVASTGLVAQEAGATPEIRALQAEVKRLKNRQSQCETMDEAEKLALIRALQEIRDAIGMIGGDRVSPKQIVDEVRRMCATVESQPRDE